MAPCRRAHKLKMQAKEVTKENEKSELQENITFPQVSKKDRLSLKERLRKWDSLPAQNNIFMLESDFKIHFNKKKRQLVLPQKAKQVQKM